MKRTRTARQGAAVLAAAVAMTVAPAAAFAVNVSSNDGSGTQSVSTWYRSGGYLKGTLKSTAGNPVYYNGELVIDNAVDVPWGRYTTDTTSTTGVQKPGQVGTTSSSFDPIDGIHVKVCRNRANVPDPCGGWSTTMRHP